MRNLKVLGLALVAALAMSLVAAPAVWASLGAGKYPVVITGVEENGTENNYWEFTPGHKKHCANVTYEATLTGDSADITVTPHYTNCVATVGGIQVNSNVDLNGCHYLFTTGTIKVGGTTGSVHIVCPTGPSITTTAATCTTHVPPQTLGGAAGEVTFTNKAGGDITLDIDITGSITATETDGFLCPFAGETHVTNGSWFSTITLSGFEDSGQHHVVTVDPDGSEHTLVTGTEGAAVGIEVS